MKRACTLRFGLLFCCVRTRRVSISGAGHKPNSVALHGRDGNHSSCPRITPEIQRSTQKRRTGRPSSHSGTLFYLTLLRVGFALPPLLPTARCALTAPFHPYPALRGGVFSVALSVGSPLPRVTRHTALWSSDFPQPYAGCDCLADSGLTIVSHFCREWNRMWNSKSRICALPCSEEDVSSRRSNIPCR
jgi:hypothetical protein